MITTEELASRREARTTQNLSTHPHDDKIIDFFAARRTLLEEAKKEDQIFGLHETVRLALDHKTRQVRLPDSLTDALLVLVLAAVVLLGLLVISGFG